MMPTIKPEKIIMGAWPRRLQSGDIVIVRHDGLEKVKRVKYLSQEKIYLVGDNPASSTDSRDFGWIDMECVVAKVIWF